MTISTFLRHERFRRFAYQAIVITLVIAIAVYLISNVLDNLNERNIRSGFGFLKSAASYGIGTSLIPYTPGDTYARAYLVGVLNTLMVSLLGIFFASIIGIMIGIMRLSTNWLAVKLASIYVESVRNIPLLLQLFFWYAVITRFLPDVTHALQFGPWIFLSKSGFAFPVPVYHPVYIYQLLAFVMACFIAWRIARWSVRRMEQTGRKPTVLWVNSAIIVLLPLVVWWIGGAPMLWELPRLGRFNFQGGSVLTPEFMTLLMGLTLYTAAFIAEVVRSGIKAVPYGQTEAAYALGLRHRLTLRLVVFPQTLRIIIPPTINQYLNLLKNSSLAVAIGYPDLVSISNVTLNLTGQAIECISIMMAIYLTISLSISAIMNVYNRYVALAEK